MIYLIPVAPRPADRRKIRYMNEEGQHLNTSRDVTFHSKLHIGAQPPSPLSPQHHKILNNFCRVWKIQLPGLNALVDQGCKGKTLDTPFACWRPEDQGKLKFWDAWTWRNDQGGTALRRQRASLKVTETKDLPTSCSTN